MSKKFYVLRESKAVSCDAEVVKGRGSESRDPFLWRCDMLLFRGRWLPQIVPEHSITRNIFHPLDVSMVALADAGMAQDATL